jgi:hypothetical protein
MADGQAGPITPPPGYKLDAPTPPAAITPPPGYTLDQPSASGSAPQPETMLQKVGHGAKAVGQFGEDVLSGIGGGAIGTVAGAEHLVNKALPKGAQLPEIPPQYYEQRNVGEKIGGGAEALGEFIAGDEALKGITKLAALPEGLVALAEKYPRTAKLLASAGRAATVGAAQGAVKGATQGEAAKGAIEGGIGGGAGAGVMEGVLGIAPAVARVFGLGGRTFAENLTAAGRPAVTERNWKESLEAAKPLIVQAEKAKPIKTIGEFVDLLHDTAADLWKNKIAPQVARHANEVIDGRPVAMKILQSEEPELRQAREDLFPEEAKATEDFANKFQNSNLALSKANAYLQVLNAKLKNFYKMTPEARAAIGVTDSRIEAMEDASSALRESIYNRLAELGEETPAKLRQQYGAIKDMARVFGKRATVTERQAPLNLQQVLGLLAGAVEPGAAVSKAIPFGLATAAKVRNAPESLIRQGLRAGAEEMSPSALRAAARTGAVEAAGAAGAAVPRESESEEFGPEDVAYAPAISVAAIPAAHTLFVAQDGSQHIIPTAQLDAARQIDPKLQVLEQK